MAFVLFQDRPHQEMQRHGLDARASSRKVQPMHLLLLPHLHFLIVTHLPWGSPLSLPPSPEPVGAKS